MHKFTSDFYGETLKIVLLGQIRPMVTFKTTSKIIGVGMLLIRLGQAVRVG